MSPEVVTRYVVEQMTSSGWVELARVDDYEDASEIAMAARAAGAGGIQVRDVHRGRRIWGVEGGQPC